jgi:PAS domain S-box-containing protein
VVQHSLLTRFKYVFWSLIALWTGTVLGSLIWNYYAQEEKILEIALNNAHLAFEKDVLYRRWAAEQGGIYVPVSNHTPPNPYLKVPDRDIQTAMGVSLTLVNPAYMTRQVNEMGSNIHSRSHITSLNPIRPQNSPDPWETSALKAFEKGLPEVNSIERLDGKDYMRVMRPFVTENSCLKCHADQGYNIGDIRGGISVSIPMEPLRALERPFLTKIISAHGFLWVFGLLGIALSRNALSKQILAREAAESVVRESEKKLKIMADFTYDMESWRRPDGGFEYISPSCERITGYSREEFMRDPGLYLRIIHPLDHRRLSEHLEGEPARGQSGELEFRIIRRDGQERWIGHVYQTVSDEAAPNLGLRISDRDITKRKEVEETLRLSEEKFALAFAGNPAAICMTRLRDGVFLEVNDTWTALNGYSRDEAIGRSARQLPIWPTPEAAKSFVEELEKKGHLRWQEQEFRKKSGEIFVVRLSAQVLSISGEKVILSTMVDITEIKHLERELRKSHEELEIRVRERTAELARSNAELDQFAYVASHDLQEPLRKIEAFGTRLKEKFGLALGDQGRDYIDRMRRAAERMENLIDDLLLYSRVATIAEPFSPVDLSGVPGGVLEDLETALEKTGGRVEIGVLPVVKADPNQMRQLFQNLIGNALKFHGEEKPVIHVYSRVSGPEKPPAAYQIIFQDNGIGFEEKYLDRIFRPFQRLHGRSAYEGTGMGLAICRKIAERHGGLITAHSRPGQGATFVVTLPVEQSDTKTN